MGPASPSLWRRPRTSVLLPLSSSLESSNTLPGPMLPASAAPSRAVASASGNLRSVAMDYGALVERIRKWGQELGFDAVGIADADLSAAEPRLLDWLAQGRHGEMEYMARNAALRARPAELTPGTLRVISCRMDYLNDSSEEISLAGERAVIARYARGRDYHKVLRSRLQKLCDRIEGEIGAFGYRAF